MIETITKLIHQELLQPEWESTRQLLAIMDVALDNGLPRVEAIVINEEAGRATGYVAVKDEAFYIGVHFVIAQDKAELTGVDTEPAVYLSFSPWSADLSCEELLRLTTLTPQKVERVEQGGEDAGSFISLLEFESSKSPGRIEEKLDEFLSFLEQDAAGIRQLIAHTDTGSNTLLVGICFHLSNRNFTRLFLPQDLIARLHRLGLELTFDLWIQGRELPSNY
ncbi:DUF4279 domain-containing protein [Hymenobacter jeollabukensis]|uniref:DUF4279 domain-containing protein n=1 Tax=Hymenobacter jeollabukensis TaxID=2025313 RepID=A0A5R8WKK8_9BACT|nr:DUF4279 domain-containing protein [Hymenobacter jeollabukensis]TLM89105.1 DUF4279 domain-containing protein [Hymenobacter jeollabukensis]